MGMRRIMEERLEGMARAKVVKGMRRSMMEEKLQGGLRGGILACSLTTGAMQSVSGMPIDCSGRDGRNSCLTHSESFVPSSCGKHPCFYSLGCFASVFVEMTTRHIFDARSEEGPIWKSSGSHIPTSRHKIQILDLHPEALSIPCSHVTRGPRQGVSS